MTPPRSEPPSSKSRQTVEGNGCLSGFFLPPLAALLVSVLLVIVTYNLSNFPSDSSAQAAAGQTNFQATIAPLFTPEVQFWGAQIVRWASSHDLDPNLAATVMQIESCGNPDARSNAGATGLFQVMPDHFFPNEDAYDPNTNASRGLDYLQHALQSAAGNTRLALAGYNGGIAVIGRAELTWPAETLRYAYWGSGIYTDAAQNAARSARLDEWLAAGGASLCQKAHQRLGISP